MSEVLPIVYFTHAELNEKENIDAKLEVVKNDRLEKSLSMKSRKKIKLTIQEKTMNYEAIEEDEQPFIVGYLDKNDGSMTLCNTSYFVMKPECYVSTSQSNETSEHLSVSNLTSYTEKLNSLTAAFGSSKKRKAMQTKLKNKIETNVLEKALNDAVEQSKTNILSVIGTDSGSDARRIGANDQIPLEQFSILPVPNKNAKNPNEVYDLNETLSISKEELNAFTETLASKFATATPESVKKWKDASFYSEYVLNELSNMSFAIGNYQYKLDKCKQLAYMSYLISLYRLKPSQFGSKNTLTTAEVPGPAINRLFDIYTVVSASNAQSKSMRTMPRRLRDKLICHILILALHIDAFTTSIQLFQKDLKLSVQKLVDYSQALGCYIKSQAMSVNNKKVISKIAQLKLPLNDLSKQESKKRARKT